MLMVHPRAGGRDALVRGLTKNPFLVNDTSADVVNPKLTIVNWRETHLWRFQRGTARRFNAYPRRRRHKLCRVQPDADRGS